LTPLEKARELENFSIFVLRNCNKLKKELKISKRRMR